MLRRLNSLLSIACILVLCSDAHSIPAGSTEVVFIDTGVADWQTLAEGVDSSAEVVLGDRAEDGVQVMAAKEIVIFTADVPDKQVLIDGLRPGVGHYVLDENDGLAGIVALLEGERDLASHGEPGNVLSGKTDLREFPFFVRTCIFKKNYLNQPRFLK